LLAYSPKGHDTGKVEEGLRGKIGESKTQGVGRGWVGGAGGKVGLGNVWSGGRDATRIIVTHTTAYGLQLRIHFYFGEVGNSFGFEEEYA
jgi:hypothetical protein